MSNFMVFAGTSEGRRLVEQLAARGASVCASVATEYGKKLLPQGVQVFAERLDAAEMTTLLQSLRFDCVVDATHPYAAEATGNIRAACEAAQVPYLRLYRPESRGDNCVYVEDADRAAEVLSATTGNVLLTTGSKELDVFSRVPDYQNRLFVRVLPALESIQRCLALGYQVKNIVAMQGPFSREMNAATMRQVNADILVTKESGDAGGFAEKLAAARDVGATTVVIGRPEEAGGLSFSQLVEKLEQDFGLPPQEQEGKDALHFPVFVNLSRKRIALFGGGSVAARRACALMPFCGSLTVVSPQVDPAIEALGISVECRTYLRGDCTGYDLVLAATDNREVNHAIHEEARSLGIPVNVSDCPEECDFYFPAIARQGNVVLGVTASGADHTLARQTACNLRAMLDRIIPQKEESDGQA